MTVSKPSRRGAGRPEVPTKDPGVYRRGNRYVVRVVINGRKVRRSAATAREAKALRAELVAQRHRGTFRRSANTTLAAYAESWLASYHGRTGLGVRRATVDEYRRDLELHVLPALGSKPLGASTSQDV